MQRLWKQHDGKIIFGLAITEAIAINALAHRLGYGFLTTISITLLVLVLSHTLIYLHVHGRIRVARSETITRTKDMLKDQVLNRLAQINTSVYLLRRKPETQQDRLERIETSVSAITDVVNNLSEEEIERWHAALNTPKD